MFLVFPNAVPRITISRGVINLLQLAARFSSSRHILNARCKDYLLNCKTQRADDYAQL